VPVFFYLIEVVDESFTGYRNDAASQRLREYYQSYSAGQGHGNQYYPGVQWDVRDSSWRYITILDLPFSLVFDTLLLPLDASHGPITN
jgi:uncharacterized protein YceK